MARIARQMDERWRDFRHFVADVWTFLNLPEPTWIQDDICSWLASGKTPKRSITEAFRGIGKSWLTVALVIWMLYWCPQYRILVVSASKDAANEFSTFCFRLINEMPGLSHLRPRIGQRDSKIAFDVAEATPDKAPSVKSLGITSQLTGSRADIVVLDDIEIPSNSLTQAMRAKLAEQIKEIDAILKAVPHARVIVLGTPQCEQSVYNEMQKRGYVARIWPSRFPDEKECEEYGSRLAPTIATRMANASEALVGQPTDPKRFTDTDLAERALSYGKAGYAMQFQLRTKLADAEKYPLKVNRLIVMDCDNANGPEKPIWCNDPERRINDLANVAMNGDFYHMPLEIIGKWIPYAGIVMSIDPAGRGKDETSYCVLAQLNGFFYVLACGGLQGGYDEHVLRKLVSIAKTFAVRHVVIEANFGDGMFTSLLNPYFLRDDYPVTLEEVKHSVQKEKRILDTLEPLLGTKRIVMDRGVIEADLKTISDYSLETQHQYSLIYQLTRLTREKGSLVHDDRLDALAIACNYFKEEAAADADTEQEAKRIADLDLMLEKFVEDYTGIKTKGNIWSEHMR